MISTIIKLLLVILSLNQHKQSKGDENKQDYWMIVTIYWTINALGDFL